MRVAIIHVFQMHLHLGDTGVYQYNKFPPPPPQKKKIRTTFESWTSPLYNPPAATTLLCSMSYLKYSIYWCIFYIILRHTPQEIRASIKVGPSHYVSSLAATNYYTVFPILNAPHVHVETMPVCILQMLKCRI